MRERQKFKGNKKLTETNENKSRTENASTITRCQPNLKKKNQVKKSKISCLLLAMPICGTSDVLKAKTIWFTNQFFSSWNWQNIIEFLLKILAGDVIVVLWKCRNKVGMMRTRWWPKGVSSTMDCCRRSNFQRWIRSRLYRAFRFAPRVIHRLLARSRPSPLNWLTCKSALWRRERPEIRAGQLASLPLRRLIQKKLKISSKPTPTHIFNLMNS